MKVAPARQILCALTMALALVGWSRPGGARSVPVTAQLDYAVATGCPAVDTFAAIVAGRLGYDAFREDAQDRIVVRIEPAGRTLKGRVEWRQASGGSIGEQVFPSRTGDCAELARAMGFALAVQIQLMATIVPEPPPLPLAAPAAVVAAPPASAAPATPPPPSPPSQVADVIAVAPARSPGDGRGEAPPAGRMLLVGAGGSVGLGLATGTTVLGRLFGGMAWPHFGLELSADASVPSTTHRADGTGFSQELFGATLAACGLRGAWSACAVGRGGALRVTGTGVDVPLTATGLTTQAGVRVAATHELGHRTYIVARAEGLARLTQGTVLLDSTPAWRTPRFAALFGIDIALRFQ